MEVAGVPISCDSMLWHVPDKHWQEEDQMTMRALSHAGVRPGRSRIVLLAVTAIIVSACSAGATPAPTTVPTQAPTTVPTQAGSAAQATPTAAAGLAASQAEINQYLAPPAAFTPPGTALDGKAIAAGKTIMLIPSSSTIPFNVAFDQAAKTYAEKVGFKVTEYPTTGLVDEYARGIELGINQKVAAIALTAGTDYTRVIPQIQEAQAAGIPVITSIYAIPGDPVPAYIGGSVPLDYPFAAELEANYAIVKTNGTGDILIVGCAGCYPSPAMTQRIKDTIAKNCPACKVHEVDVPIPQWATDTQTDVQAQITADPNINWVIPHYDALSNYVVAALQTLGKVGKVGISTFNGTPSVLQLVQSGKVSMDISEDINWCGASTVDAILRVLGKVSPSSGSIDEHIPFRVFDSTNVSEAGNPPAFGGMGTAVNGYLALWGVQ